ncbi:MAG: cell division protein FtsQ/DivIB [Candidatus Omnitrophica bacterium]|nr:cell division protein FtsQ/DivIB [Candidatus Omnitrophota bacterium]MDD5352787.1 cell division protein FtsQ/DivIB [Candidatus Omnitrophota bacterium]MDD5550386.1 cell division protein FtsQ/DivIB [Candidatus Omnitrophota bacterium]
MRKSFRGTKNNKHQLRTLVITLVPTFAFLLSIWLLILGVRSYLNNSSYFNIKKVVLNGINDKKTAQQISAIFLNENIFGIDLGRKKDEIKIDNPQFHELEVTRNFPDQVTINLIIRRPLAQIKQRGFFLVDNEGVIVSDMSSTPFENFMIISNLKGISSFSFGKKINIEQLKTGLRLVQSLRNILPQLIPLIPQAASSRFEIDLAKYPSLYVYFTGIEVRFYKNNLDRQVQLFIKLLPSIQKRIDQVQYIDLRFMEPAVSFKNEKKNIL